MLFILIDCIKVDILQNPIARENQLIYSLFDFSFTKEQENPFIIRKCDSFYRAVVSVMQLDPNEISRVFL